MCRRGSERVGYRKFCARCDAPGPFAPHDARRRGLRAIVEQSVVVLTLWIARWRCRKCRHVFTDTPPFVLPYKRYDASTHLRLARDYLENDRRSYRQTVRHGKLPLGYRASGNEVEERALHHMTVWRTLLWLGAQLPALASGREIILQQNPSSTCHRIVGAVAPHKFRNPQRERTLRQARQLMALITEWERTFPEKFFPRFATRSGFD